MKIDTKNKKIIFNFKLIFKNCNFTAFYEFQEICCFTSQPPGINSVGNLI